MYCLKCWNEVTEKTAVYTKSCHHVFCDKCSSVAFKKELSCPLCDTVLPKDGIGSITLIPDSHDIKKVGAKIYGFQPEQMCEVLKLGLDFWVKQKQSESLLHERELGATQSRMVELEEQNAKLTRALNEERLKRNSVQNEKDALQKTVSDLEARYAQKARSMRKLTELYNELRQVHKRLEADLRGVRDTNDFELEVPPTSEFEVNTYGRSGNMSGKVDKKNCRGDEDEVVEKSVGGSELINERRMTPGSLSNRGFIDQEAHLNSAARQLSAPADVMFNLAPNRSSTTNIRIGLPPKNVGVRGARRRSQARSEVEEDHSRRGRRG